MAVLIADFAGSVLALGITISSTTASVSDATSFPTPAGGDYFYATIEDSSGNREIVKVTEKVGNVFTIERAKGGTSARAFDAGSVFQLRFNALTLTDWKSDIESEVQDDLDAMQAAIDAVREAPAGTILLWPTEVVPPGALLCNGAEYSRTTYDGLYAGVGVRFGAGDGSTTFNVPNLLGLFPRFWANGSGYDPDRASRLARADGVSGDNPGTTQRWAMIDHRHVIYYSIEGLSQGGANCMDWITTTYSGVTGYSQYASVSGSGVASTNLSSYETRPYNVALTPIIVY